MLILLRLIVVFLALCVSVSAANLRLASHGGPGAATPVITFNAPSASYIYPSGPGTLLTTVTATVSPGSFLPGGGTFTSSNCTASDIAVATGGAVTVGASNLSNSHTCLITANYPGAVSVTQTFTLTGTQQTIASISPCSLGGGCSYTFTVPATSVTLGSVPAVTMSGGISFSAGGGTIVLGTGLQCADFAIVSGTLQITATPAATYACTYVIADSSASNSPQTVNISAVGNTSTGVVFSQTVQNIAGTTTPTIAGTTMVATHFGVMLPPASVPSGDIVVAKMGGSTLPNAQIDSQQCSFWPDGSLKSCPFSGFVPQMASGGTQQVNFALTTGTFPTSSSVTPATIAAASDFKVVLSNMNGSWIKQDYGAPSVWWGVYPGFYVTGGAISGGYIRNQPTTAGSPQGLLGNNCTSGAAHCITPSNYQASVSTTTSSGSPVLTFSPSVPVPAQFPFANLLQQVTIIDVTNPSAIPDNTTVLSTGSGPIVTMSANAAANIPSTDILEFGYTIHGGTSNAAYTVNTNGSGIVTGVNIIKAGAGFSAIGSGAMTADIDTILNAYGTTQPPACASMPGAAIFTESYSAGTMTVSSVTGVVSIGQMVDDGTNLRVITGGSGTSWTVNGSLVAGPVSAIATPAACVYTSGPTMYGIRGLGAYRDNVSGVKDAWERFRFTIEYWTGPTGLYAIKPTITTDNSIVKNQQGFPNVAYDADFLNGSTEIIGCAQGGSNNKWCAIQQQQNSSWTTLDPCEACTTGASGRPVWLPPTTGTYSTTNSQALAQVVLTPASADLAFIHASHLAPPLDNTITVTPSVLTTTTSTFGNPFSTNLYAPYSMGGMDQTTGFGSGGANHFGYGPMGGHWGYWYHAASQASDNGVSWLQNLRVAADVEAGVADGPRYDDTGLPINMYESGASYTPPAAFTDTPMWDFVMDVYYQINNGGFPYPHSMWQGAIPSPNTNSQPPLANLQVYNDDGYGDTSHFPEYHRAAYLLEGERYMLETWIDEAEAVMLGPTNTRGITRSFTLGSTRYDAQYMSANILRQDAWAMNTLGPLAKLGPPNEPAIQYIGHVVANNYAMNNAFISWTGSGNFWNTYNNASSYTLAKVYDNTSLGIPATPATYSTLSPNETITYQPFMLYYWALDTADMVMLDNGNDTNLTAFAHTFLDNAAVKAPADNCATNLGAYTWQYAEDVATRTPQLGWDATTFTGTPQRGSGTVGSGTTIHSEAGSSVVSASLQSVGNGNWLFIPTATSAVSTGGTSIPLSSVASPSNGNIATGWVIKDLTSPTALTWPTYVTGAPSGLNIPISSPVTGPGISLNDQIAVSSSWPWVYPPMCSIPSSFSPVCTYAAGTSRLASGTKMTIANVNWNGDNSPNDVSQLYSIEAHTVPSSPAFTVTTTHAVSANFSVNYASGGAPFTKVTTPTVAGQYSRSGNVYTFSSADAGANVTINYTYSGYSSSPPLWPPSSTPTVADGQWLWLCMDASGAAFGQLSTTQPTISGGVCTGGTTYVTWNVTEDFSTATVANASCPAPSAGDWRYPTTQGEEVAEMYPVANWRQALDAVLGTSTDAPTAATKLSPYVTPLSSTYSSGQIQWGGDNHF